MSTGRFKRGYLPDPVDHKPSSFDSFKVRHPSFRAFAPKGAASLAAFAPSVMDQGDTSSCTGHACAGAIATTFKAQSHPLPFVPSPAGIYTLARSVERSTAVSPRTSTLPRLSDDGAIPMYVWKGIHDWGVRPIKSPTSDRRYSDAEPRTINAEPTFSDLLADRHNVVMGEHRIDSTGAQRVQDFCLALDAGYAITFAVFVDTAFENWTGGEPLGLPDTSDPNGGGHYLYAVGYRTDASGKRVLRFRNSWGALWGLSGDGEGNEDFIGATSDAYVVADRLVKG